MIAGLSPRAVARKQTRGARPATPARSMAWSVSGANSQRTRAPGRRPPEVARMVGLSAGTSATLASHARSSAQRVVCAGRRSAQALVEELQVAELALGGGLDDHVAIGLSADLGDQFRVEGAAVEVGVAVGAGVEYV